jgi:hypothetical protein
MMKISTIIILTLILIASSSGLVVAQDEEGFVRQALVSKRDAIVLSILYPGLGQMTLGQKLKGMTFFVVETTALVIFANSHENYKTKQKKYDADLSDYNNYAKSGYGSYKDARALYTKLVDRNNELDDLHTLRETALIVAGGMYVCNIIDAFLFSSVSGDGKNAKYDKKLHISSTVIDTSPGVMLSKRF